VKKFFAVVLTLMMIAGAVFAAVNNTATVTQTGYENTADVV